MRRLEGKVAAITGASTGFGRGIAVAFAREGAKVVVGDITPTPSEGNFDEAPELTTVQLVERGGGEAAFAVCDVTRQDQVAALARTAVERFGRLDVWVNNAGVYRGGGPMHTLPEQALDDCLNVLVKGSWFGAQEAIKVFLAQGSGNLINIVSTAGLRGHPGQAPYNIAKAGQANLTRCLALEYAGQGIRVNAVCPTYMKTAMSRAGVEGDFDTHVKQVIPLGRWGEVADVVNLAVFLASDESAFIHGALIPVDGGETLGAVPGA